MKQRYAIGLAVVSLIIILFARFLVIGSVEMDHDEVRSISRTFGSPLQIMQWQPPDWPPLYYLVLAAYRVAVGFHPFVMRYFSILCFAISIAAVYRLSLKISEQQKSALMSAAAYATLGLVQFQSTHVRGYSMAMALFPIAFWFMIRVFDSKKLRNSEIVKLAIVMAALFCTSYTSVPAFVMMGLYSLMVFPIKRIWRWFLVGIVALPIASPLLWKLLNHIVYMISARENARSAGQLINLEPYPQYQWQLIRSYTGAALPLWIALALILLVLLIWKRHDIKRNTISLLSLTILGPVLAALVLPFFGLATPHYSWWAILPMVLLVGMGLRHLPNRIWQILCVGLLIFPFIRLPVDNVDLRYGTLFATPFESTFEWLQDNMNPGDVIFVDPRCNELYEKCGTAEEWEYYQRVYFPDRRLHFVSTIEETENVRRVWYLHIDGWQDSALQTQIAEGRQKSIFVGPWDFLWQLYEAPPDPEGILYENGMRFHGYDILDPALSNGYTYAPVVRREGEFVILRLWWSVDEVLSEDYSISTVIAESIDMPPLVQLDGPPQTINLHPLATTTPPVETSRWVHGQIYIEERILQLPSDIDSNLRDRPLGIFLTVYQWWDAVTIDALGVHENGRRRLRDIFVLAY